MPQGYVLSERDYLLLKADHYKLQRELTNLKRSIARGLVRKHQGGRTPTHQIRFRNDNAGTVPARGIMRITGANTGANTGGGFVTIDQPDSTYRWLYLVNGERDIGPVSDSCDGIGFGSFLTAESFTVERSFALYDSGSGTPACGDEWGPTASSWKLSKYHPGFFIIGGNDTTNNFTLVVQRTPAEVLVNNAGSDIAAAASGTLTLYGGTAGSESTLGMTISAWNHSSVTLKAGKFGAAALMCGNNYGIPLQT